MIDVSTHLDILDRELEVLEVSGPLVRGETQLPRQPPGRGSARPPLVLAILNTDLTSVLQHKSKNIYTDSVSMCPDPHLRLDVRLDI